MNNLADFKRYLSTTGERPDQQPSLRMVSLEYWNEQEGEWVARRVHNPNFRGIAKLQTNRLKFDDDSWLDIPTAKQVEFDSTRNLITITKGYTRLTYKWANTIILA